MTERRSTDRGAATRDWHGDAQRRIARALDTPALSERPGGPRLGARPGRTLGVAMLLRGRRTSRRMQLAATLRAPEDRPALRRPLRPRASLRPRLTIQSASTAPTFATAAASSEPIDRPPVAEPPPAPAEVAPTSLLDVVRRLFLRRQPVEATTPARTRTQVPLPESVRAPLLEPSAANAPVRAVEPPTPSAGAEADATLAAPPPPEPAEPAEPVVTPQAAATAPAPPPAQPAPRGETPPQARTSAAPPPVPWRTSVLRRVARKLAPRIVRPAVTPTPAEAQPRPAATPQPVPPPELHVAPPPAEEPPAGEAAQLAPRLSPAGEREAPPQRAPEQHIELPAPVRALIEPLRRVVAQRPLSRPAPSVAVRSAPPAGEDAAPADAPPLPAVEAPARVEAIEPATPPPERLLERVPQAAAAPRRPRLVARVIELLTSPVRPVAPSAEIAPPEPRRPASAPEREASIEPPVERAVERAVERRAPEPREEALDRRPPLAMPVAEAAPAPIGETPHIEPSPAPRPSARLAAPIDTVEMPVRPPPAVPEDTAPPIERPTAPPPTASEPSGLPAAAPRRPARPAQAATAAALTPPAARRAEPAPRRVYRQAAAAPPVAAARPEARRAPSLAATVAAATAPTIRPRLGRTAEKRPTAATPQAQPDAASADEQAFLAAREGGAPVAVVRSAVDIEPAAAADEEEEPSEAGEAELDSTQLEKLACSIYPLIKRRVALERERRGRGGRWE